MCNGLGPCRQPLFPNPCRTLCVCVQVTTGLSAGQIARLPTRTVGEDGPTEGAEAVDAPCCCICCYEHAAGDKLLILPCKHEFHLECLAPWLRSKRLCPLCKAAAAPPIAA